MPIRRAFGVTMALLGLVGGRLASAQTTLEPQSIDAPRPANAALLAPPVEKIPSPITDYFSLRASFFDPRVTTELRVDPPHGAGLGTTLNGEQQLGLDSKPYQGSFEVYFRLGERNRLRVDFFQLNRSAEKVLTETTVIGRNTFATDTAVSSEFDWQTYNFTYTYSFLRNDRVELGAGLGLTLIQAGVTAAEPYTPKRTEENGLAPVPTLALDGTWRISRRFALTLRGQYFGATVKQVTGHFGDYHGDLQFRALPNLALGVGYSDFDALLENEGGTQSLIGRFSFRAAGPEAFARVSF